MIQERTALVSGGNRGIGFEACRQLAALGVRVYLGSRDLKKGLEAAAKLQGVSGKVIPLELDVMVNRSVERAVETIKEEAGRLDILVNNAGVYLDEGQSILDIPPKIFERTIAVNLMGPFYLIQAVVPLMEKNHYGRIVNVSSGYGSMTHLSGPGTGSYKISKVGLNALTRLVADGVHQQFVKVNCIDPGWVRTDMGGPGAPVRPDDAAKDVVWAATLPEEGPTGGFFYKRQKTAW
jgi:NAD(P)-dependent dehydrogenase (short-subunit alcohol dehydrogenase family)